MIDSLRCHEETKNFLKNELKREKSSGTYLFYGNDGGQLREIALAMGKSLNCPVLEKDFCGECDVCRRMDTFSYSDLEIFSGKAGVKINDIREIISKVATTAYEGGKKIFILEDINRLSKEVSNALLKTIEEPPPGNYFFLLSTSLNVISTIKSRSIIVKIPLLSSEELGVTREEYEFFNGSSSEILEYKKENYSIWEPASYSNIGKCLLEYFINDKNLRDKIEIYKAIRDFSINFRWISALEKMQFIENICRNLKEREFIFEILGYMASLDANSERIEKILEAKNRLRLPVNMRAVLSGIFLK